MKMHRIAALVGALLLLPFLCLPVFAAGSSGTLYLHCATHQDGQRVFFTGDEYSLTKIADVQIQDTEITKSIQYVTLPEYQQFDCDWSSLNANEAREKAKKLGETVPKHEYTAAAVVNEQGVASFTNLESALYLVRRTKAAPQHKDYLVEPFLISVPMLWEGEVVYDITSSPKYGWPSPDVQPTPQPVIPGPTPGSGEVLPQTGQLKWPIPVLLILGGIFILAGVKICNRK